MIFSYGFKSVMVLATSIVLLACGRQGEITPSPLPDLHGGNGHGDCPVWMQKPLNAAVWAETGDSLIVGTVTEVKAVSLPFAGDKEILEPDECSGTLLPALQVTLDEVTTYAGNNLDGEEVVLTFGHRILAWQWQHDWGVTVIAEEDGSVVWVDEDRGRITLGQRLGIDMYCDPELEYCANGGRPLFTLDEHDRIVFQEIRGGSCERVPEGLQNLPVADLDGAIAEARETAEDLGESASRRRDVVLNRESLSRFRDYFSADCLIEHLPCDPPCEPSEVCVDGVCVSEELDESDSPSE